MSRFNGNIGSLARYFSTKQNAAIDNTPIDIDIIGSGSERYFAFAKRSNERSNDTIDRDRKNEPTKSIRENFFQFDCLMWEVGFGSFNCHATKTKASAAIGH
jgi:hypothetical protein